MIRDDGDYARAIIHYKAAVTQDPKNDSAYALLADCYLRLKEAKADIEKAKKLDAEDKK